MHTLKRTSWAIALGLLPALVIYIGIAVVPIGMSFYYSLVDWDGLSDVRFVGLDNFTDILSDPVFWNAVKNNLIMMATGLAGQLPLGLLLALALNRAMRGIQFFRTVGFLPVVISAVIVSLIWSKMYGVESGLINQFLGLIGLDAWKQNWLGSTTWAMLSLSVTYIWQNCGLYMVIYLAALQNIPSEINESAMMDGATGWKRVLLITIPMIRPTIWVTVVFAISNSFRVFDLIYVMTAGGPAHNTEVMTIYMYINTFTNIQFGYGSAVSVLILIFSLIVIYGANKLTGSREADGERR
ncbi:sugar ABC transporter permease [Paenibacillus hemerocallicola]|uniref:Sugar ABC transporter permease n=1 Tax=Paenibacillus hemerocallicola TaxID=1172614 RepID=A0A5C4TB12_9BACL|nr:sugar ABC transporter permease [Paenibacillus hemerocallicola]TNJ66253.1 sugar ABC transporter permease [Paenibacillus hemerocallicola]